MTIPTPLRQDQMERQTRLTIAFVEAGLGSSAVLYALVATIYRNEPERLARLYRVGQQARRIGEEIGLDERTLTDLERAAWVQHLGTLVLGDLKGNDAWDLSDLWRAGEQAQIAADVAGSAPFLRRAADLVRASRECFDGSGFPMRLRGNAIPLGSRILHVAETIDALVALCSAMGVGPEVANLEISRWAGTRLDPRVVAAWIRCSEGPPRGILPGAVATERHL